MYSTTGATSPFLFEVDHQASVTVWENQRPPKGCFYAAAVASVENQQRLGFVLLNPGAETLNQHEQECSQLRVHQGQDQDVILSSSPSQVDKESLRTEDVTSKAICKPSTCRLAICKPSTCRSAIYKLDIGISMEDPWVVFVASREM